MIEIKKMYHKKTGEIVFEDVDGQWWEQQYQDYIPEKGLGNESDWQPVVATQIEKPE